jgi:hypothetical protein
MAHLSTFMLKLLQSLSTQQQISVFIHLLSFFVGDAVIVAFSKLCDSELENEVTLRATQCCLDIMLNYPNLTIDLSQTAAANSFSPTSNTNNNTNSNPNSPTSTNNHANNQPTSPKTALRENALSTIKRRFSLFASSGVPSKNTITPEGPDTSYNNLNNPTVPFITTTAAAAMAALNPQPSTPAAAGTTNSWITNNRIHLSIHVALTSGEIQHVIMGNPSERMDYCIYGPCLASFGDVLSAANKGELAIAKQSWDLVFPKTLVGFDKGAYISGNQPTSGNSGYQSGNMMGSTATSITSLPSSSANNNNTTNSSSTGNNSNGTRRRSLIMGDISSMFNNTNNINNIPTSPNQSIIQNSASYSNLRFGADLMQSIDHRLSPEAVVLGPRGLQDLGERVMGPRPPIPDTNFMEWSDEEEQQLQMEDRVISEEAGMNFGAYSSGGRNVGGGSKIGSRLLKDDGSTIFENKDNDMGSGASELHLERQISKMSTKGGETGNKPLLMELLDDEQENGIGDRDGLGVPSMVAGGGGIRSTTSTKSRMAQTGTLVKRPSLKNDSVSKKVLLQKFINQSLLKKMQSLHMQQNQIMRKSTESQASRTNTVGSYNNERRRSSTVTKRRNSNFDRNGVGTSGAETKNTTSTSSHDNKQLSEFRTVTVIFVHLHQQFDAKMAQKAFSGFLGTLKKWEGVFQQYSVDDKGQTMLACFGLPVRFILTAAASVSMGM